jgi:prepilin-type N-terminal cleavage/methylation domain-containing protein
MLKKLPKQNSHGFTLIELIIVITIIGLLAGIMLTVVNYKRFMGESRNARRKVEVNTIATSVYQYTLDKGDFPPTITDTPTEICNQYASNCSGYIDLSVLIAGDKYLTSIPSDPSSVDPNGTGYIINKSDFGRVLVSATYAEVGATINATR